MSEQLRDFLQGLFNIAFILCSVFAGAFLMVGSATYLPRPYGIIAAIVVLYLYIVLIVWAHGYAEKRGWSGAGNV